LKRLVDLAAGSCHTVDCRILPVVNRFFGETIDVAGLVTGGDLISQLSGRDLGGRLLIPAVMLRHGGDVFLDDVTPEEASRALGVPVLSVQTDGASLAKALFEF
jgi:NifB/MoaA-like Fe-S oxidoreductase